jgi:hypothetical protein
VLAALLAAPAFACSYLLPPPFETVADAADTVAPAAAVPGKPEVRRGRGPRRTPGGWEATSCDDMGEITVALGRPPGDAGVAGLGYEVTLSGTLPEGLRVHTALAVATDRLVLPWLDGSTDAQEAFDLVVTVVTVDRAGNRSAPAKVSVRDPGRP